MALKISALVVAIFVLTHCKTKSIESDLSKSSAQVPAIAGFDSFFNHFHEDSVYQLSHIVFPLEGLPEQDDTISNLNNFRWSPDQWILHRAYDMGDSLFAREFKIMDSTMIIERIYHRLSAMHMERRFSKTGTEWSLIYYAPLRARINIEIN